MVKQVSEKKKKELILECEAIMTDCYISLLECVASVNSQMARDGETAFVTLLDAALEIDEQKQWPSKYGQALKIMIETNRIPNVIVFEAGDEEKK